MKKTITKLAIALGIATTININAQITVTFDTFTLAADTFYENHSSADFTVAGTTFQYEWDGTYNYWSGGTSYTNKKDTINTVGPAPLYYTNVYSCIPGSAFSGANYATVQQNAVISFSNNTTAVTGFYITNTTYAWKVIKRGNFVARKFGDTTGTHSGTSIPQGEYPDWFKVIVRGYRGGSMITDSVEYYLADYRAPGTSNDYVIKNWQYVNCAALGQVDSIKFEMKSSDVGNYGINTPTFFSMDNFTTQSTVGIEELTNVSNISLFPNPTSQNAVISYESQSISNLSIIIFDVTGKEIEHSLLETNIGKNQEKLHTETLNAGIYFIEISDGTSSKKMKFIKL
ncbi:MAG: DUF4465 domain-containing protein [Bacteroidetes bacterium]|nr:DUF4465 domain-containing protein [Bacteroidota bacterium]